MRFNFESEVDTKPSSHRLKINEGKFYIFKCESCKRNTVPESMDEYDRQICDLCFKHKKTDD